MSHSDTSVETVKASEGKPEADTQDDLPRCSDRISQPTERMVQYKSEEIDKRERKLFSTFDKWRLMIREVRNVLKSVCQEDNLHELLDRVKTHEESVIKHFRELRSMGTLSQETVRKVDACSAVSADMLRVINETICEIDSFDAERETARLKDMKNAAYARSIFSKSDAGSTQSKLSEKMVEASAEFAAKPIELNMLKEEQIQKERLSQLEYEQKLAMEAHQNELKRLETRRELEVAHARLNAYSQMNLLVQNYNKVLITDFDNTLNHIKQEPPMNQKPACLAAGMDLFNVVSSLDEPKQQSAPPGDAALSFFNSQPLDNTTKDTNDTNTLAKALAETVNLNRLPVPEPAVFTGDPLHYIEWKTSFRMLIERRGVPASERIFYLKKYLGGAARKALEGFFYNNSESTYESAKRVLEERYGHPFIMQKAFRDKLDKWPKIATKDPIALRDFADFLQGCLDAIPHVPSLSILNDCTENQKLLGKLPVPV